jgi:hypothetical protein
MTPAGKEQAATIKWNAIAMANLTMAFTSEAMMGLVFKAKTQDWPSGLAHLVMSGLYKSATLKTQSQELNSNNV